MVLVFVPRVRKPMFVNTVQVTKFNMAEVAKWCGGEVVPVYHHRVIQSRYIKVPVIKPGNVRQTQAFINDWLVEFNGTYKIYTPSALANHFDEVPVVVEEETPAPQ